MKIRFDGKTALITGGSRGIGKAIAMAFAEAGANVVITARKAEQLEAAAQEIGTECFWLASNVGAEESAEEVVDATIKQFGGIDILVNNAATNPYVGHLIEADLPRWNKTIQVNLTAPLLWTQAAWKAGMKDKGGVVLNVASVGGLATSSELAVYNVTKAALIHTTKQLAAELAPGVRVNAVAPALIKTDFARLLWEGERGEKAANTYPLKRLGEVEDIANAAMYLCSDAAGWVTGQTLVLDGGATIDFLGI
ncbi:MAG: SDR family oxidoreductase [Acidimicrobiales bacterium]|nr:SDR family oxidoreductase [Acidimicrobiales bacterium]